MMVVALRNPTPPPAKLSTFCSRLPRRGPLLFNHKTTVSRVAANVSRLIGELDGLSATLVMDFSIFN